MKCFIYRNLHKPGYTYSIKALEGPNKGRIIAYGSQLCILDPVFKVSKKGRQRVLATKRKNVHAGIVGKVLTINNPEIRLPNGIQHSPNMFHVRGTQITYNPYKYDTFVERQTEKPIHRASVVQLDGGSIEVYGLTA